MPAAKIPGTQVIWVRVKKPTYQKLKKAAKLKGKLLSREAADIIELVLGVGS